jgi:hypothetical protein
VIRRRFAYGLLGAFVAAGVFGVGTLASAQLQPVPPPQRATIEVMVLHATQSPPPGSIGPGISNAQQLQQPPFSAWNTYRLLAKQGLTLNQGAPMTYTLPNGRVLQVTLQGVTAGPRFKIAAAINQPGGTTYLKLLEVTAPLNQTFFVAGQVYQGGMLIIGFTVK